MEKIEDMPGIVVCDAGPLIHLDELECLILLKDFNIIAVPQTVWHEVSLHRPTALEHPDVSLHQVNIQPGEDPEVDVTAMIFTLQQGEKEALQIAHRSSGAHFLTDDTAARLAARSLGIVAHGTIGLLLRSIRRMQKSKEEVIALLQSLPHKSTLFIKPSLLEEIIRQVQDYKPE